MGWGDEKQAGRGLGLKGEVEWGKELKRAGKGLGAKRGFAWKGRDVGVQRGI